MEEPKVWIILGAVLGSLVLAFALVFLLFFRRRSRRKMRGFTLRAVTPLDDAEFESWRRPSQYTQRPQTYASRFAQPTVSRAQGAADVLEKEIGGYEAPRTPSPLDQVSTKSPSTPIRKPERARRKSSVCSSLADRPPTPYSPASTLGEFTRSSYASRKSYVGPPRIHYPSMSEASAFNFDFNLDFDAQLHDSVRPSSQSERPLNLSYGHGWHHEKA
jgi:hypothetical protein